MSFSLADSLSKTNISELIGSVVEEGDVYRDCSDFKIIKKERFATMFSAKKSIAKISNDRRRNGKIHSNGVAWPGRAMNSKGKEKTNNNKNKGE